MASFTLTVNGARLDVTDEDDCNTIADVLEVFREAANIPAGATALVNGEPAETADTIPDGAEVSLNKPLGQKGI